MPEIDGEKLIAFLKAMEFTTITRRVGEICSVDSDAVEADPDFVGPGGWRGRNGEAKEAPPRRGAAVASGGDRRPQAPLRPKPQRPQALARLRAKEAKEQPFDVTAYPTVTEIADLEAWIARAQRRRRRRLRHRDDVARSAAGRTRRRFACGRAGRSLLHSARPSRRARAICSPAAGSSPARFPRPDVLARAKAAARRSRRPEDRPEREVRLAHVQSARHRRSRRSTTRC